MRGLWLRGGVYWLDATLPGRGRVRISLETGDPAGAIQKAREIRAFPDRHFDKEAGNVMEIFFAERVAAGKSDAHLKHSRIVLQELGQFCGGKLENLSPTAADRWWKKLPSEKSQNSANQYLGIARFFYKWALGAGHVKISPVDHIIPPRTRAIVRKVFLKPSDALRVLDECKNDELKFCLFCALHCGMRHGEVIAARPHWFDLAGGSVHVQNEVDWLTKDRDNRAIPLTAEFREFLKSYGIRSPYMFRPEKKSNPNRKVWQYRTDFRGAFMRHMINLGINKEGEKGVTFHDLRRTFASLHASRGTPIFHIARWLGDDPSVVERTYAHLLPNDSRINDPWTQARSAVTPPKNTETPSAPPS